MIFNKLHFYYVTKLLFSVTQAENDLKIYIKCAFLDLFLKKCIFKSMDLDEFLEKIKLLSSEGMQLVSPPRMRFLQKSQCLVIAKLFLLREKSPKVLERCLPQEHILYRRKNEITERIFDRLEDNPLYDIDRKGFLHKDIENVNANNLKKECARYLLEKFSDSPNTQVYIQCRKTTKTDNLFRKYAEDSLDIDIEDLFYDLNNKVFAKPTKDDVIETLKMYEKIYSEKVFIWLCKSKRKEDDWIEAVEDYIGYQEKEISWCDFVEKQKDFLAREFPMVYTPTTLKSILNNTDEKTTLNTSLYYIIQVFVDFGAENISSDQDIIRNYLIQMGFCDESLTKDRVKQMINAVKQNKAKRL